MLPFGSLQRRLLAVVLVALAPIVALSGVNLVLSARQQRADQLRATTETMRAMVGAVDTELDRLTEFCKPSRRRARSGAKICRISTTRSAAPRPKIRRGPTSCSPTPPGNSW